MYLSFQDQQSIDNPELLWVMQYRCAQKKLFSTDALQTLPKMAAETQVIRLYNMRWGMFFLIGSVKKMEETNKNKNMVSRLCSE